jgi:hypothetical protein
MTKLAAKLATAAALVALATPALPCGDHAKTTTAEKKTDKAAEVAKKDADAATKDAANAKKDAKTARTDEVRTASAKQAK